MLINFGPQARSSTGICAAWPGARSRPGGAGTELFSFSRILWQLGSGRLGPASLGGGDNKRYHHCRYPSPRHPPLPTHENQRNPPRNGERSSWLGWIWKKWRRSAGLLVGMSGDSVLADGWPSPTRLRGIQSHPWDDGSVGHQLARSTFSPGSLS